MAGADVEAEVLVEPGVLVGVAEADAVDSYGGVGVGTL